MPGEIRYARGFGWVASFISFLVLAFALNFVVAAMNLVPLPLFDGYHLMRNGVGNQLAVRAISYIVAAAFPAHPVPVGAEVNACFFGLPCQ